VFVATAVIVAVLGGIFLPLDLMPSELWAYRPLQLADGVVTVLLGAALFIRHPDVWATCRPLGAAVVLLAIGTLIETAGSVAVLILWRAALGLDPGYLSWTILGLGYVGAALGVLGIALIWMALRRSLRHADGEGLGRLAVVLWASTLFLVVGRLASTVQTLGAAQTIATPAVVVSFTIGIASLVTLTALTVTAIAGARVVEGPTSAWWLAGASGLIVIFGEWLVPVLGVIVQESLVPFLVPQVVRLASTLLLLTALALGLPLPLGHEIRPAADSV
jgi:hypothetical protein